jgi:hypothetical protein
VNEGDCVPVRLYLKKAEQTRLVHDSLVMDPASMLDVKVVLVAFICNPPCFVWFGLKLCKIMYFQTYLFAKLFL